MTTDIHAIIAAAKRVMTSDERPGDTAATYALLQHRIDMAEALDKISRRVVPMGSRDEYRRGYLDALDVTRDIARDVLAAIEKDMQP